MLSSHSFWIGNSNDCALCNQKRGKLLAIIEHDGYGKYYTTVYVNLLTYARMRLEDWPIVSAQWLGLQVAVQLLRTKSGMERAQSVVEELFG